MTLLAALTLKVSAILLLALVAAFALRTRSASGRHWVLAVGVVSAGAAPAFHFLPVLPLVEVAPADAGALGPAVASVAVTAVASHDVVGRLAVTIWLAGLVVSALVLLVGLARLRWLRASSTRVTDGPWHRLCSDLAQACGLKRGVELLLGPRPGLVATWGWRRPVVVLPESASGWSEERMRVVLLHELAHARRGDWLLQMVAEALRCVWWFNPLGVGGPGTAPPRERARGGRPRAGARRSGQRLCHASRRACERASETPADVVAGAGHGASVTPGTEAVRHVESPPESTPDNAPRTTREPGRTR